jgi:hypothetical protein
MVEIFDDTVFTVPSDQIVIVGHGCPDVRPIVVEGLKSIPGLIEDRGEWRDFIGRWDRPHGEG